MLISRKVESIKFLCVCLCVYFFFFFFVVNCNLVTIAIAGLKYNYVPAGVDVITAFAFVNFSIKLT